MRGWRWQDEATLRSAPVRCKREQWYLARARTSEANGVRSAELLTEFLRDDEPLRTQCVYLDAPPGEDTPRNLLGWVKAPEHATHLRLVIPKRSPVAQFERVVLHPVAERDPKCHPLANVPRWGTYKPPFPLERVVLPSTLEPLAPVLKGRRVDWLGPRISRRKLATAARRAACVIDPAWLVQLDLRLEDLERIAAESWLIVDLETLAMLVAARGAAPARVAIRHAKHEIMSARVEYADVPTRGFALQDVVPYSTTDDGVTFRARVLTATAGWKRYADNVGFATLLASETPVAKQCGDVLSAARPIGRGELITTDLPWIVAGAQGSVLAPRVAQHLLKMHLGGEVEDFVQYWMRWDESDLVVRDIADLARRYPQLRTLRWASADARLANLGLAVMPEEAPLRRRLLFRTGRIDNLDSHDGLPPEPMLIFMKWLAREVRERTSWARRYLADVAVCWQFDTAAGLRYTVNYESAAALESLDGSDMIVRPARPGTRAADPVRRGGTGATTLLVQGDVGIQGDGSLAFQRELTGGLRALIEKRDS